MVDVVGPIRITDEINDRPWIDPSAFANPPVGRIGNLGRNSIDGPGFFNLDASLFKKFPITERWNLEFRARRSV
jgi:hypothetical protein